MVGRRIAAAIVDGLLHFAVNAVVFFLLAEHVSNGWQLRGGRALLYYLVSFGFVALHYGWLQGTRGFTLGKHAAHIRVIGPDGAPPGMPRALLRTIVWLADAAPWCIPGLLGFILVVTTRGHRRLGDMAADTYVVSEEFVAAPLTQS